MIKLAVLRHIRRINVMRMLCDHLLGEKHSALHHRLAGLVVMTSGVMIAKSGHLFHFECMEYICDGTGYFIHALGATPFIEAAIAVGVAASPTAGEEEDGKQ